MQHRLDPADPSSSSLGASEPGTSLGRFARLRSASHSAVKPGHAAAAARDDNLVPYNGPVTVSAPTYALPLSAQTSNATTFPVGTAAGQPSAPAPVPVSIPRGMQGGIGESPAPVHKTGGGFSAFWGSLSGGGGSGSSSSQGFGRSSDDSTRKRNDSSRRSAGLDETFAFPRQKASGSGHRLFHRQPRSSNGSMDFQDSPPANVSRSRLPSSTSVPTGLAAPPLLFSPTHRGMALRASGSVPDLRESMLQHSTDSLPLPSQRRPHATARRWNAPTACDTFVLPRPKLVAHTITPPISPERKGKTREHPIELPSPTPSDAKVLQEGDAREREREEWARKARGRGRSLSFSSLGRSELAGSSLVNVRSRSKSQTRTRTPSMGTDKGRTRSASFSSRWTRAGRKSESDGRKSEGDAVQSRQNSQRSAVTLAERQSGYRQPLSAPVGSQYDLLHRPTEHRRAPSLMDDKDTEDPFSSRQNSSEQPTRPVDPTRGDGRSSRNGRELRFKQVAPVDVGGVVIISHPTSAPPQAAPETRRRSMSVASADKPLPALPPNAQKPVPPPSNPVSHEIGIAISPDIGRRRSARKPPPALETDDVPSRSQGSSAHARGLLQREHKRSITKRAFLVPSYASKPSPTSAQPSPRTPLSDNWQRGHQASSSVPSVPLSPSPSVRKRSTMEEAVGRGRAASAGQSSLQSDLFPTSPASRYSNSDGLADPDHRVQILAAAGILPAAVKDGSPGPSMTSEPVIVPLGAPINNETPLRPTLDTTSGHASSISSADWLTPQHSLLRAALDASSPLPTGHSSTSSPMQTFEDEDYNNLFYNAPPRRSTALTSSTTSHTASSAPAYHAPAGHGLGVGLDSDTIDSDSVSSVTHRQSLDVSDGTLEMATPVHATSMYEKQNSGSSRSSALGPASIQGSDFDPRSLLPPPQIVDQDDYGSSNDDSPPMLEVMRGFGGRPELSHMPSSLTHSSSEMTVQDDDASVRFSQVSVGQAVHIATPPLPDGELPRHVRRTSVVPERGSSSQDDLLKLSMSPMPPVSTAHHLLQAPQTPTQGSFDDPRRNSAAVSFIHEFPSPPRNGGSAGMVRRDTFGTWDELANLSNEPPPADDSDDELEPPRLNRMESTQSTATVESYATAREGFSSSVEG